MSVETRDEDPKVFSLDLDPAQLNPDSAPTSIRNEKK